MAMPGMPAGRTIHAIIFDMDNTLFDFVAAKLHACRRMTKHLGTDDPEAFYRYFTGSSFGYESHENIRQYLRDRGIYTDRTFTDCCSIYEEEKVRVLEPYPRIHAVLEEVKRRGYRTAVVTDAHNGNALRRLRKLDLVRFFDVVVTFDMTGLKKPSPEPFLLALEMLGTSPDETLLVGDSLRRDIAPAKSLGLVTAHARYGDRNFSAYGEDRPDCVLMNPGDILACLEGLSEKRG